jgi:hypothetical protein
MIEGRILNIVTCLAEYRNDETVVPNELRKGISAATVSRLCNQVLTQQPIWKCLGNRFVETHAYDNAEAKETEFVEMCLICGPPVAASASEFQSKPHVFISHITAST